MKRNMYRHRARLHRKSLKRAEPLTVMAFEDINFQISPEGRLTARRCHYKDSLYRGDVCGSIPGVLTMTLLASTFDTPRTKQSRRLTIQALKSLRTAPCTISRVPIPG